MKKIFLTIISAAAVLSSCNTVIIESAGHGQLSVELSASDDYNSITKAGVNEDVNSFKVSIISKADGAVAASYEKFADMPQVIELISGAYTINASSPNLLPAAFDQPIYGTTHDFTVKVGEVTTEKLVCTLQNVKVTFSLSDSFKNELDTYTISVSNGEEVANTLYWTNVSSDVEGQYLTKNIEKAGYFTVAPLTIRIDGVRSIDGSEAYREILISDAQARDHFVVGLDAKVTGSAGFDIEIDTSLNVRDDEDVYVPGFDEDPVEDDDSDDSGNTGSGDEGDSDEGDDNTGSGEGSGDSNPNDMTMTWEGHESVNNVYPTANIDGSSVDLLIDVPGKIAGFVVQIDSESEEFMSVIPDMTSDGGNRLDLINDSVAIDAMMADGIELIKESLEGKTQVSFNLTGLLPMIQFVAASGTNHVFTLEVTDKSGYSETWKLTFYLP